MTTESGSDDQQQQATPPDNGNSAFASLEDAVKAYSTAKEELEKLSKNLEQSRKEEKFSKKELKALKDQLEALQANSDSSEWQSKYEAEVAARTQLETKIRTKLVDSALETALKEAKAKSVSTVMKLINRDEIKVEGDEVDAKSIEALISKIRTEDPVLFDEVQTPSVKRAAEGAPLAGFEAEIRKAKTHKEIEQVMRRYGKM